MRIRFQFTPLREGRQDSIIDYHSAGLFQFTPLREGRHNGFRRVAPVIISIHAPPRGATLSMYNRCPGRYISIHAPPRGATISCVFISTSRFISIHAPPRGATELQVLKCTCPKFQFTPLREGRHCRLIHSEKVFRYFNSRPSARGDGKRYAISANLLFNPYKSAWLNNSATQFVEIILVIFHRIIA